MVPMDWNPNNIKKSVINNGTPIGNGSTLVGTIKRQDGTPYFIYIYIYAYYIYNLLSMFRVDVNPI